MPTSFKSGDAITFYAGVQRKKPKGSDRVPVNFEEYQIEVPGGCVLVPWDTLMEKPGGFDSLDLCGHLANHTSKVALQKYWIPRRRSIIIRRDSTSEECP